MKRTAVFAAATAMTSPSKLASSQLKHGERTVLEIGGAADRRRPLRVIAGPCAVESRDQTLTMARVAPGRRDMLRGGAYKPRTSPYAFQGLGQEGLRLLAEAKSRPACRSSPR